MTWTKFGSEFFRECLHHGLSDPATRTHAEGIAYLYDVEEMSCRIPKHLVRTFAGSEHYKDGIDVLVSLGWWKDHGSAYEVMHHADVVRQSIAAQRKQRETSKKTSARHRQRKAEEQGDNSTSGTTDVTRHVTPNADRQTTKHLGGGMSSTCEHGTNTAFWKCHACDESRSETA